MPKKATKTSKALQRAGIDIPDGGGMNIAAIFNKAIAKVAKTHEKDITALDANRVAALVGIPLGHLSLEMLFTENVLALGRVMCFDGVPETCKTSLLWEMCRLFHKASGDVVIMDTEKKQTESLGPSIVGHDMWSKVNYTTASSTEEAYQLFTVLLDGYDEQVKETGKRVPILLGMDSISGAVALDDRKKIDETGTSSRGWATNALLAARYLPYFASRLGNLPINFIAIRHVREVEQNHIKSLEAKGGTQWGYSANKTFRLARDGTPIDKVGSGGRSLLIHLLKGRGERLRVPVTMEWYGSPDETGKYQQYTRWGWPEATLKILTDPDKYRMSQRYKRAVKEILGAMPVKAGKVSCQALGVTDVNAVEFEEALYAPANISILTAVRTALGIATGQEFRGGDDFDEKKTLQRGIMLSRRDRPNAAAPEPEQKTTKPSVRK